MRDLAFYYSPGACSLASHAALYEWGAPFQAHRVMLAAGEHLKPDFLELNPRARVPLLIIDGQPVRENSGILTWIGQQANLYPAAGTLDAAKCAEWLGWMTSTVHIAFAMIWRGERFAADTACMQPSANAATIGLASISPRSTRRWRAGHMCWARR